MRLPCLGLKYFSSQAFTRWQSAQIWVLCIQSTALYSPPMSFIKQLISGFLRALPNRSGRLMYLQRYKKEGEIPQKNKNIQVQKCTYQGEVALYSSETPFCKNYREHQRQADCHGPSSTIASPQPHQTFLDTLVELKSQACLRLHEILQIFVLSCMIQHARCMNRFSDFAQT